MGAAAPVALLAAGQVIQGIDENNQALAQARALDENARLTETQGAWDASNSLRVARLQQGKEIASAASDGIGLPGSVADLIEANAVQDQLQAMNIRYAAGQKARGLRIQADQARAQGRSALFGGVIRAGAAAFGAMRQQKDAARLAGAQALGSIPIPAGSGTTDPLGRTGKTDWWGN